MHACTPSRKVQLTIEQKKTIRKYRDDNNSISHEVIAQHFSIEWNIRLVRSTVSGILRADDNYSICRSPGAKRMRSIEYPQLEECLYLWFCNIKAHNIPISDMMLTKQAQKFGEMMGISDLEFKYSSGWLCNFKKRYGLKEHTLIGERGSVKIADVLKGRIDLKELTSKYDLNDIYNFDETALYYRMPPNKTLANVSVSGTKESKERLTVGVCCNSTGTHKLKLVVIAKFARPRCFGKVFDPNHIVDYYNNQKAWMTTIIFEDWLKKFNARLRLQNRNILLLVDNATSHNTQLSFSNITLQFLPPNTTSVLQPCDAGIIRSFKCFYKNKLVDQMVLNIEKMLELYIPDVKEALFMSRAAWELVSKDTIHNCWLHVDILKVPAIRILRFDREEQMCDELKFKIDQFHKKTIKNLDQYAFKVKDYLELDSEISTGEILTDEQIIQIVISKDDD